MPVTAELDVATQPERRPEARTFSIEDLLREVASGRIRMPRFQRGLRWDRRDRLNLFDSLYRGFPVGTLLFWRAPAEAGRSEIGRFAVDAEARPDALWVIDGQQRITTLVESLLARPGAHDGRAVCFDLDGCRFVYGKAVPHCLPLAEVFDPARLLTWTSANQIAGPELSAARDLGRRLREYEIVAYVIEAGDEQVVRQMFARLNSSGKSLKSSEIFDALHSTRSPVGPGSLREAAAELSTSGFGTIDEDLVLRALVAMQGNDPAWGFRQIAREDVPAALAETTSALRQAITFVKTVAGFPRIELLPYQSPLATLSFFFHEHRDPTPRTRRLLTRWLWRGAISGAHRGDTVGLRRTLKSLVPGDQEKSVQNLLAEAGERPSEPPVLRPFRFNHCRTKLQLTVLAALGPRHLESGMELDIGDLCARPNGPAVRLSSKNRFPEEEGLANRLLHPPMTGLPLRKRLARCADEAVLRSHVVSPQARQALKEEDFQGFLRQRELDLQRYVESFLDAKAEWDASDRDRPSLASLVVTDEDE